jgi:hypothetical protein
MGAIASGGGKRRREWGSSRKREAPKVTIFRLRGVNPTQIFHRETLGESEYIRNTTLMTGNRQSLPMKCAIALQAHLQASHVVWPFAREHSSDPCRSHLHNSVFRERPGKNIAQEYDAHILEAANGKVSAGLENSIMHLLLGCW